MLFRKVGTHMSSLSEIRYGWMTITMLYIQCIATDFTHL
jgi:hypothetical protein